jgi:hypothetical protein
MYPNFPQQVLDMSPLRLYINAISHYLTNRLPEYTKLDRLPLFDKPQLRVLDVGTMDDFEAIFSSLVSAKGSLSEADKEDVAWFVERLKDDVFRLMPKKSLRAKPSQLLALCYSKTLPVEKVGFRKV